MTTSTEPDPAIEIVSERHDLELGVGTQFVSRLADAGTTLVTRGLAALGRPELALMLFRAPVAFPDARSVEVALEAMAGFLRETARTAAASRPIREGTIMSLAEGLVKPHLRGIVWVKPPPLVRARCVPPGAFIGVPLFLDEVALARDSSPYRVLTRLGMEIQEFPFPPWLDASRASVSLGDAERSSVLGRLPSARADVAFVAEHTGGDPSPERLVRLSLRVHAGARAAIMRTFSTRPAKVEPLALIGVPSEEVGAWLAWRPEQQGFCAIESPGAGFERVTGSFFAIVPGEKFAIDRALMAEDGYLLFPTVASWTRLHAALATGAPFVLPLQHGRFELSWDVS
jgi:hypothetical protein